MTSYSFTSYNVILFLEKQTNVPRINIQRKVSETTSAPIQASVGVLRRILVTTDDERAAQPRSEDEGAPLS